MKKIATLLLSILLASSLSHAGVVDSGGGNALICFGSREEAKKVNLITGQIPDSLISSIVSIEALDLIEARQTLGDQLIQSTGKTYIELLEQVQAQINQVAPDLLPTQRLGHLTSGWMTVVQQGGQQRRIQDEDMARFIIPGVPCLLATVAEQKTLASGQNLVYLDQRIFDHPTHSELSKAALMIHEYLYLWDRLTHQATYSKDTRSRVSIFLSSGEGRTRTERRAQLAKAGLL